MAVSGSDWTLLFGERERTVPRSDQCGFPQGSKPRPEQRVIGVEHSYSHAPTLAQQPFGFLPVLPAISCEELAMGRLQCIQLVRVATQQRQKRIDPHRAAPAFNLYQIELERREMLSP